LFCIGWKLVYGLCSQDGCNRFLYTRLHYGITQQTTKSIDWGHFKAGNRQQELDLKTQRALVEKQTNKTNSVASVRERTIPIERPPLVGEVSALNGKRYLGDIGVPLLFLRVGARLSPLGTSATIWPIVPATDGKCGAVGGMSGKGNRSNRRKPAPAPILPS
jgi:hypothetical protein